MRRVVGIILLLALLTGCASSSAPVEPIAEPAAEAPPAEARAEEPPALSENRADWTLSDFTPALCGAEVEEELFAIAEGTEWENTVVVRRGAEPGPTIYIIGGVHGDETAGWVAGNLLRAVCPKAGTVCVLSPANTYGAANDRRTTKSDRDLNRNFPGDPEGWDAERIAASIYADIAERRPDLLLDLHETKGPQENAPERDDLRNSIIVNDVAPIADLVWALTVDGTSGEALTLLGSPPAGSVNRTVSEQLGIPAITLETWRGEALSDRVARQLAFVEAVLRYYGML